MAIYTPTAGGIPRAVVDGVMQSVGGQGQPVITTANNNRVNPTPQFSAMDQVILSLDALYDSLPNQAAWVAYALAMTGQWDLCANCQPDASAKKIFRQLNFWRQVVQLATVTVPPAVPLGGDPPAIWVEYYAVLSTGYSLISLLGGPDYSDFQLIGQIGLALGNPIYDGPYGAGPSWFPGDPFYIWWVEILNGLGFDLTTPQVEVATVGVCCCHPDGQPGHSQVATCDITIYA